MIGEEQVVKQVKWYQVERQLNERERFLRTLIGNLPGVVYRCRVDEQFTSEFLSDGCFELTGYTAEELTQTQTATWNDIIHREDRESIRTEARALLNNSAAFTASPFQLSYRIITRGGSIKYVRDRFRFISDSVGKIVALEGFVADVTKRALADEQIRKSESRYRLLAENTRDIICLLDLDGKYTFVSPSSQAVLGFAPDELLGNSIYDYIHAEEIVCVREDTHNRLLKGETDLTTDYRMRRKSGEYIWLETMAQTVLDENGKISQLLTVSRETTRRKNVEQEYSAAQEEIARLYFDQQKARKEAETAKQEAERANFAKDEFLQLVSHEFRTPLTTIKILASLLQDGGETEKERKEHLEVIVSECDRQIDMILNLLDVARVEEGSIDLRSEPVDINRLLLSREKIERHAANARRQKFSVEYNPQLPPVRGDEKVIRRALGSIIENAIKYTPVGGSINIAAKHIIGAAENNQSKPNGKSDKRKIPVENSASAVEEVAISITDTGRGIRAEDIPRLFDKFYRTDNSVSPAASSGDAIEDYGVGLGLYLANRLITELGGRIEVKSEVGRGSCFTIFLAVWNPATDELDTIDNYGFDEGATR
ncbi:MAG: PAS domain-containing protein [Pyrinomonadaceae bacterium]